MSVIHKGTIISKNSELYALIEARNAAKGDEEKKLAAKKVEELFNRVDHDFMINWPPHLNFLLNWKIGYEVDLKKSEEELAASPESEELQVKVAALKKKCGRKD